MLFILQVSILSEQIYIVYSCCIYYLVNCVLYLCNRVPIGSYCWTLVGYWLHTHIVVSIGVTIVTHTPR